MLDHEFVTPPSHVKRQDVCWDCGRLKDDHPSTEPKPELVSLDLDVTDSEERAFEDAIAEERKTELAEQEEPARPSVTMSDDIEIPVPDFVGEQVKSQDSGPKPKRRRKKKG